MKLKTGDNSLSFRRTMKSYISWFLLRVISGTDVSPLLVFGIGSSCLARHDKSVLSQDCYGFCSLSSLEVQAENSTRHVFWSLAIESSSNQMPFFKKVLAKKLPLSKKRKKYRVRFRLTAI